MKEIDKIIHFLEVGDLREDDHIEFKSNISASNRDTIARVLVALANNDRGGYLIVGVVEGTKGISCKGVDAEEDTLGQGDRYLDPYTI
jgi:predicted HTH transcriptional regulator